MLGTTDIEKLIKFIFMRNTTRVMFLFTILLSLVFDQSLTAQKTDDHNLIDVGMAMGDISPITPIRLGGYGARSKAEATSALHTLEAKALVLGADNQKPVVFITLDLVGLSDYMTTRIVEGLKSERNIDPAQIAISASHTHGSPEVGNIINILQYRGKTFSDSLLALEQLDHIAEYNDQIIATVLETVEQAFDDRKPSVVAWGQGQAGFAKNRRTEGGPVDPALPIMKITSPDGDLRGVLVNYACHGTTLPGVNKIHGDWISEAKLNIEKRHPGALAMIAIGCAGDANPNPRGKIEDMKAHGIEIADQVDRLLNAQLEPITSVPECKMKRIDLPFSDIPTVEELIVTANNDPTVKGYYARLALDRILRGTPIPETLSYPVQVWTFGDEMAMVNLAGEVVVDYSIRLKNALGAEMLWVNAYMNEVPCYIASERVIEEGGYEAESSMYYYDKPSPFSTDVEDMIVHAVHDLMPARFKAKRPEINRLIRVVPEKDGLIYLQASEAKSTGPTIQYMPEWKAFGWFNTDDEAEWEVKVKKPGKYKVYLEWSVDDARSGKTFEFGNDSDRIKGEIGQSGSWFTFRKEMIGTIALQKGLNQLVFQSGDKEEKGAMLDLRKLILVPES